MAVAFPHLRSPKVKARRTSMDQTLIDRITNAVLYEGYLLYPYRPSSVKNRQRWTFGGVYPRAWSEAQGGTDPWEMRTECLLSASNSAVLTIRIRFLHLLEREAATEREVHIEVAVDELAVQSQVVPFYFQPITGEVEVAGCRACPGGPDG